VQNYNPKYLDILWVVDDRSPMSDIKINLGTDHLVEEATKFFTTLDNITAKYRMAITTSNADSRFDVGSLMPKGQGVILSKNIGTLDERKSLFSSLISNVINLKTGAKSCGFTAALAALTGPFKPVKNVPLVIVFISDSDERSSVDGDAVDYFASKFIELKDGRRDLIKIYSINYFPLNNEVPENIFKKRCATVTTADIDVYPNFQDRYFRMVDKFPFGGKADLCGNFADSIDLSGLSLRELTNRFKLSNKVNVDSLEVKITKEGSQIPSPAWKFDSNSNEIVFDVPPPEGSTIYVLYFRA